MIDTEEWDATLIPLAVELMTAAAGDAEDIDFLSYCQERVAETATNPLLVHRLVAILATFGGEVVSEWARDMGITPSELMSSIVADIRDP